MLKTDINNFPQNLVFLRKAKKLTQKQLAESIGVAPSTIASWENGKTYPRISKVVALANFFEVSVEFLSLDYAAIEKSDLANR